MKEKDLNQAFQIAQERYAEFGVDVETAMEKLERIPISMHCWQGDDVGGFETPGARTDRRRHPGHRQLSRQGSHHRRAARRHREGAAAWFPAATASTCTPATWITAANTWTATPSSRATSRAGSIGPKPTTSAWTSTPPTSPIPRPLTALPSRTPIRPSAISGSTTASPAAKSAPRWAASSARPR